MKRALSILVVSMFVLGLLVSAISCTKTVYIIATPTPTPAMSPTPSPSPTPYVLYPNRPDRLLTDIELRMGYGYKLDNGLSVSVDVKSQSPQESNVDGTRWFYAKEDRLFFEFWVQTTNKSDKPITKGFPYSLELLTPIGSSENFKVWDMVTEVPHNAVYYLYPGQAANVTLPPNQTLLETVVFEAINLQGTYYVICDPPQSSNRLIWGFVHDGLSD